MFLCLCVSLYMPTYERHKIPADQIIWFIRTVHVLTHLRIALIKISKQVVAVNFYYAQRFLKKTN